MRNIFTKIAAPVIGLFMLGAGATKADATGCDPRDVECNNGKPPAADTIKSDNTNLNKNDNSAAAKAAAAAAALALAKNENKIEIDNDLTAEGGKGGDGGNSNLKNTNTLGAKTGDQNVTIGGDDIDARSGAAQNTPNLGVLYQSGKCTSGKSFTLGASAFYFGGISGGFSTIDPAGSPIQNGYSILDYFEARVTKKDKEDLSKEDLAELEAKYKKIREDATEGFDDEDLEKLNCLEMDWDSQEKLRTALIENREDLQDHELVKLMLEHYLNRLSNAPGTEGASIFEHMAAPAIVAEEVETFKEAMILSTEAYFKVKDAPENKGKKLRPVDFMQELFKREKAEETDIVETDIKEEDAPELTQ